jgi:type IV pilus assembly protein PilE
MKRHTGFTMMEVLVVMAIVAILSALAYPSYAGYITKTRRIEGQIALLEALQQQERFYTQNNTYSAFSSSSTDPQERRFKWWSGSSAAGSAYELRAHACPAQELNQCVEIEARPGTAMVDSKFRDRDCETMTLNSVGQYTSSGRAAHCWP